MFRLRCAEGVASLLPGRPRTARLQLPASCSEFESRRTAEPPSTGAEDHDSVSGLAATGSEAVFPDDSLRQRSSGQRRDRARLGGSVTVAVLLTAAEPPSRPRPRRRHCRAGRPRGGGGGGTGAGAGRAIAGK